MVGREESTNATRFRNRNWNLANICWANHRHKVRFSKQLSGLNAIYNHCPDTITLSHKFGKHLAMRRKRQSDHNVTASVFTASRCIPVSWAIVDFESNISLRLQLNGFVFCQLSGTPLYTSSLQWYQSFWRSVCESRHTNQIYNVCHTNHTHHWSFTRSKRLEVVVHHTPIIFGTWCSPIHHWWSGLPILELDSRLEGVLCTSQDIRQRQWIQLNRSPG